MRSRLSLALVLSICSLLCIPRVLCAQTETILYNFTGANGDGAQPWASLVMDGAGNLFGTSEFGGTSQACGNSGYGGCGTVFELVKTSDGYSEKVLYNFQGVTPGTTTDSYYPQTKLVLDAAGDIFGTTAKGGSNNNGTVFELVKSSTGYTERVLHSFGGTTTDGVLPHAGLIIDTSATLYGTTAYGGTYGLGTVFELVNSPGAYTEEVLYSFAGSGGDGAEPEAPLLLDSSGNLFGTTQDGGTGCDIGCGTVFELVKTASGYAERVLYIFTGTGGDGYYPLAGLIEDSFGNLYGTTQLGGASFGTVFELSNSSGSYTENVLYSFTGVGGDANPVYGSGLVVDTAGNLYGTTLGTVFELIKSATGYTEKVLHSFREIAGDGSTPQASLIIDSSGNLYGTTLLGGAYGQGTAFELIPSGTGTSVTVSPSSLSFPSEVVGATSAAQSVTVTNAGTATLIIRSIASSGDFAETNTCSGSIAAGADCAIEITFTPTSGGSRLGSITVNDNANVNPQTISLSGTGEDFSLSANTTTAIVSPGQSGSYSLTVGSLGGFNQAVSLTCAEPASLTLSTCSISPTSATPSSSSSASATVTVKTTASTLVVPGRRIPPGWWPHARHMLPFVVWLLLLGPALAGTTRRRRLSWVALTLTFAVVILWTSCGGGNASGGGGGGSPGTPAGNYTLTITGTTGSGSATVTHTQSLTLTVQ